MDIHQINIALDILIAILSFGLFIYTAQKYNFVQTARLVNHKRLKVLQMMMFMFMIYLMIHIIYVLGIHKNYIYLYDNIAFVFLLYILFYSARLMRDISYKENKKYIQIEKIMFQILDISKADRIGLVEYHKQFASLTMLVSHDRKYYDIMGQWLNMPMSAIVKWRADGGWMEVHNSETHHDKEISTIALSYNHVSIHHTWIPDID